MKIVALDLSLTATGYAVTGGRHGVLEPPKPLGGIRRLQWIRDAILHLSFGVDVTVIEGYAFAAHASHAHELGELGGVVRCALADRKRTYVDIPPANLKLFACGKGNAKKDEVLADAIRRLGYAGHSKDEADALWLLEMAAAYYDERDLPETKQRALAKIPWPTIEMPSPVPS